MLKRTIRMTPETDQRLQSEARLRGYANARAFVRAAIENELRSREDTMAGTEQRLAANMEELRTQIRRSARATGFVRLHGRFGEDLSFACMAISVAAQSPDVPDWQKAAGGKMAFEVASIRLAKPGTFTLPSFPLNSGDAKPPGGRFSASFQLGAYIFFAYKLEVFQVKELSAQLPKWANDNYVIDAKADGNPTKDQMRLMMQSLLAERFKLKVHFETKEDPVLALVLEKPGKLGPKLLPHSEGPPCPESFEMPNPVTTPRQKLPNPKDGDVWPPQCGTGGEVRGTKDGLWIGSRNTTMGVLADAVSAYASLDGEVDRPDVDQTGLKGRFDFILELPPGSISFFPKPPNLNPTNADNPPPEPKGTLC